jgi:16S rRNA G527 N7-methylase RsmG
MNTNLAQSKEFRRALEVDAATYGLSLTAEALAGLSKYYQLLSAWNPRLHLVAPTSPREFATRHVLESLVLLEHLPPGAGIADIGSGAGLPAIPCLIVRPDLRAVLIEASPKKAVFLREALREILNHEPHPAATAPASDMKVPFVQLPRASVVAGRFENIPAPEVGFITCRALERFAEMLPQLLDWAPGSARLLLFGGEGLGRRIEDSGFAASATLIPNSQRRFLFLVSKGG